MSYLLKSLGLFYLPLFLLPLTHNKERLSKAAVANKLGIRIETLQERIDYAIKMRLKYFPEYSESKIAKKFSQMQKSNRPK